MIELSVSLADLLTILGLCDYFSYFVVSLTPFLFSIFSSICTKCKLGSKDKHWQPKNLFLLNKDVLFSGEHIKHKRLREVCGRNTSVFLNMEPSVTSWLLIIVLREVQYSQNGWKENRRTICKSLVMGNENMPIFCRQLTVFLMCSL